jgi:site-specific DNA recombinase
MRVIAYIRVSTSFQATEGVSLEAQRARIAAWAAAHGGALAEGDVFVDAGLSGKRADNRPALRSALEAVCSARGVLVVYSLSRLARSTKDTIAIAERLDRGGANLVSLSERIDTTSASGKMLFRLLAVLAEFERDLVSERTLTAMAHKRAKSERIGQVPYGWRLGPDGVALVPDEAELEALALARRLRSEGLTQRAIAGELTRAGIPTKNGGTHWSHSSVGEILRRTREVHRDDEDSNQAAGPGPTLLEQPA